jgi:uncharacterized GH25 family protein
VRSSNSSSSAARRALPLLGAWFLATLASAHDHWIAPSSFAPVAGARVDVELRIGHADSPELQVRDPRRIVRFESFRGLAGEPGKVLGLDGKSPAGLLRLKEAGTYLVAYQSDHAYVELEPAKYAEYLKLEGLDDVAAERVRRGELELPGRDSYARYDKCLVTVGAADPAGFERVLGLPFELVLETDPRALAADDELAVRLLFEGRPLADRQIKLVALSAPHTITLARTDTTGHARFPSPRPGPHALFAVHQRRTTLDQALPGDWQGFFASFSFESGSARATSDG